VVEPTRPHELAEVIGEAYALTVREREVARLAVAGLPNREIAATLWLSIYTVQDHLKAVFAKLGVRNRAELASRMFFDQYLPRQLDGTPLGGDGWYVTPSGPRVGVEQPVDRHGEYGCMAFGGRPASCPEVAQAGAEINLRRSEGSAPGACHNGIAERDFLGLSAEAATVKAEEAGWSARAYTEDSVLTADRRADRVNFELDDPGRRGEREGFLTFGSSRDLSPHADSCAGALVGPHLLRASAIC
jgi:DNA-binding CsgD family transcriptional regulator